MRSDPPGQLRPAACSRSGRLPPSGSGPRWASAGRNGRPLRTGPGVPARPPGGAAPDGTSPRGPADRIGRRARGTGPAARRMARGTRDTRSRIADRPAAGGGPRGAGPAGRSGAEPRIDTDLHRRRPGRPRAGRTRGAERSGSGPCRSVRRNVANRRSRGRVPGSLSTTRSAPSDSRGDLAPAS